MRRILATLATLGVAALGVTIPAASAQAADGCSARYGEASAGYFYAYNSANCSGYLGKMDNYDSDWGNSTGPFQGGDTNKASSLLNRATADPHDAVMVFNGTGKDWGGNYACISRGEKWADDLSDNELTGGVSANNSISSSKFVANSECNGHWLT